MTTLRRMAGPRRNCLLSIMVALLSACGASRSTSTADNTSPIAREYTQTRFQMGTLVRITVSSRAAPEDVVFDNAFAAIDEIVAIMSEWESGSDISRVNAAAGSDAITVDPRLIEVLKIGIAVSEASAGAFDLTWAPLRHVWNFDGTAPPDPAEIEAALRLIDYHQIVIDEHTQSVRLGLSGAECGLGGIAKGTAIQAAADALRADGYADFVIDAGGDVYAAGQNADNPWRIAIAHPRNEVQTLDQVELHDAVLVTSGDYERYFEHDGVRYHHLIDARTGYPARGLISVSVIAADPTVADALATAAFIVGRDEGLALLEEWPDVEGMFVDAELRVFATRRWPSASTR